MTSAIPNSAEPRLCGEPYPPSAEGVSVIVCCHNSAQRLPETLRHLATQKVPVGIDWEVVVVDNASNDDTHQVTVAFEDQFPPGRLRIVHESQMGLGHARLKGLQDARYEYLSYVDDDNWVAENWVSTAYQYFQAHPRVGAFGGRGEPVFEGGNMPTWFPSFAGAYAAGPQYEEEGDITDARTSLLWGAGLQIRKRVFSGLVQTGFYFMSVGRSGASLSSGEDVELCLAIRAAGWRLHYLPDLRYRHFLPQSRLSWQYLRRLFRGSGQSSVFSRMIRDATDKSSSSIRQALNRRWMFQVLHTLRAVARIARRCPRALTTPAQGLVERAQFDALLGNLRGLWSIRAQYRTLYQDITCRFAEFKPRPSTE